MKPSDNIVSTIEAYATDKNFRMDVFKYLFRSADYRLTSFLRRERVLYQSESVFLTELLRSDGVIAKAARKRGKFVGLFFDEFLESFSTITNNPIAYTLYTRKEDVRPLVPSFLDKMSYEDTRIANVFERYWRTNYAKSVKCLYYSLLITNPASPKFEGLGVEASQYLYYKLMDFIGELQRYLADSGDNQSVTSNTTSSNQEGIATAETPLPSGQDATCTIKVDSVIDATTDPNTVDTTISDAEEVRFLTYVYDTIVAPQFPASAVLLKVLRSRSASALVFFDKLSKMDTANARTEMGIGEVSSREVVRLCDMMNRIIFHPGTRAVFFNGDKVANAKRTIDRRLNAEHIRVYHTYQKFLESCNDSVVNFYLKVVGIEGNNVKFPGLNYQSSRELLLIFKSLLPEIDKYVDGVKVSPEPEYVETLLNLKLSYVQIDKIQRVAQKCERFPAFTMLSCLLDNWFDDRQKEIIRRTLRFVYGHPVEELGIVAESVGITRERVRQLREKCFVLLNNIPSVIKGVGVLDGYKYEAQSDYDYSRIREEEEVDFSNEYITACIPHFVPGLDIIGDVKKAMIQPSVSNSRLFLVSSQAAKKFKFDLFINAVEGMLNEKRYYPYRDELETFVRGLLKKALPDEIFYDVVKECRQILLKGFPDNLINNQIYFPVNARKTIPYLIEDILRENNRPMTSEEICSELNARFPDLDQIPSKIGPNALRNSNIVAVSRSSTYALAEWNDSKKRGGTIRDIVEEYLNSRIEPIASLSDICEYVAKYRDNVKESSIKANLLAESSNRFSLFYKRDMVYIGFTDYTFDDSFVLQEKRQARRSFEDSIMLLEHFIQSNHRFPYTSGVDPEEKRLSRFLSVCKSNIRKGLLEPNEQAAIERIETEYEQYKGKKERVAKEDAIPWMNRLESYVTYINIHESLPPYNSEEALWYEDNHKLYVAGQLTGDKAATFSFLVKLVNKMK